MSDRKPWRCPICAGTGRVSYPPGTVAGRPYHTTTAVMGYPCHGCGGGGIVWDPLVNPPHEKGGSNG